MPEIEILTWLERWYESLCNGEREHAYGVKIDTLDNPGWIVTIELSDSPFAGMPGREIMNKISKNDWVSCKIKNQQFQGSGDPKKLVVILGTFREWIERA